MAPVGRDLRNRPGDSIVIQNNADDGVLYFFANDSWMTAANNSGGLEMTLQRLPADEPAQGPVWTFASRRSKGGRADPGQYRAVALESSA